MSRASSVAQAAETPSSGDVSSAHDLVSHTRFRLQLCGSFKFPTGLADLQRDETVE